MYAYLAALSVDELTYLLQVALVASAILGAMVGSFLNVCIYRIPLEQSVVAPRSHCFSCNRLIPWYHNLPILSWFILRGKCAYCKAPFSIRYMLIEALTAGLFLMVFLQTFGPFLLNMVPQREIELIPVYWVFVSSLIVGTFIDFDHWIIPDRITLGGMVVGLFFSALFPSMHGETLWWKGLMWSGIGLVFGFGLLCLIAVIGEKVFKKEAMGFGDVKWMGAFGAFFGWKGVLFILFFSCVVGAVVGLALLASRRAKLRDGLPFGPYLALGAIVWLFWGEKIVKWYAEMLLLPESNSSGEINGILIALLAVSIAGLVFLIWRRIRGVDDETEEELTDGGETELTLSENTETFDETVLEPLTEEEKE